MFGLFNDPDGQNATRAEVSRTARQDDEVTPRTGKFDRAGNIFPFHGSQLAIWLALCEVIRELPLWQRSCLS
jgi:hypothetical protein